jgi:hypothetical protein
LLVAIALDIGPLEEFPRRGLLILQIVGNPRGFFQGTEDVAVHCCAKFIYSRFTLNASSITWFLSNIAKIATYFHTYLLKAFSVLPSDFRPLTFDFRPPPKAHILHLGPSCNAPFFPGDFSKVLKMSKMRRLFSIGSTPDPQRSRRNLFACLRLSGRRRCISTFVLLLFIFASLIALSIKLRRTALCCTP